LFFFDKDFVFNFKLTKISKQIYIFLNKKWHFDQLVNELLVLKTMNFGYTFTFQTMDKGLIEKLGPTGFVSFLFKTSSNLLGFNTGLIYNILYIILFFIVFFIMYFTFFF